MEYRDEDYVKMLRHIASHLPAYWLVHDSNGTDPREMKKIMMEDFHMPESTARACIKDLMGDNCGMIDYDRKKNLFRMNYDKLDDFYSNMNDLLSWKSGEEIRIEELSAELSGFSIQNQKLKAKLDRYIKAYGEDLPNV